MRLKSATIAGMVVIITVSTLTIGHAGLDDMLQKATKVLQSTSSTGSAGQGLSHSDIISGLKEALQVGTSNTVRLTSRVDGYYNNPDIKIPLPEYVQKAESLLRMAGMGEQVTAFERSMNRAAEKAAPAAKSLFIEAIGHMTFTDAKKILNGRDNEATLYFKDKTHQPLSQEFKPLVHEAMSEVGVTRQYQTLESQMKAIPFSGAVSFDLDSYVTSKALDGLFFVLAQEEAKIRNDPAARVTDLLKTVFR